jgi:hypothetical protein
LYTLFSEIVFAGNEIKFKEGKYRQFSMHAYAFKSQAIGNCVFSFLVQLF